MGAAFFRLRDRRLFHLLAGAESEAAVSNPDLLKLELEELELKLLDSAEVFSVLLFMLFDELMELSPNKGEKDYCM